MRIFLQLFQWKGRIGRRTYLSLGVALLILKYGLDRFVASRFFHLDWTWLHYLHLTPSPHFAPSLSLYYLTLLAMSLPFIGIGVGLTVRRLRDAGMPLWLVFFFFVPLLNVLFFLMLSLLPPQPEKDFSQDGPAHSFWDHPLTAACVSLGLTALLAVGAVALSTTVWRHYGFALFVALPFCQGLGSALLYSCRRPRSLRGNLGVACLSVALTGALLLLFTFEGMVCVLMASPLALVLAVLGGSVGHLIQRGRWTREAAPRVLLLLLAALPVLLGAEPLGRPEPPLFAVRTSVEIDAAPERVWENVVSFAELPPPREWIFRTGVAYPVRADIQGHGVGAVRHCVFSTGEFVEPVTVWEAPRLLRFSVTDQPSPMREWNPFKDIHPPHLDGFLVSKQGQFLLTPLPGGRTRLEGTTWYHHHMWPAVYWRGWSDFIIHRIHGRVLEHIKALSEGHNNGIITA